jgi:hypothetical protein
VATKRLGATLYDETGHEVRSEKVLDLRIANGKVVHAGNQFGNWHDRAHGKLFRRFCEVYIPIGSEYSTLRIKIPLFVGAEFGAQECGCIVQRSAGEVQDGLHGEKAVNRTGVAAHERGTPSSLSISAYNSPSSRKGSYSAVITIVGGKL